MQTSSRILKQPDLLPEATASLEGFQVSALIPAPLLSRAEDDELAPAESAARRGCIVRRHQAQLDIQPVAVWTDFVEADFPLADKPLPGDEVDPESFADLLHAETSVALANTVAAPGLDIDLLRVQWEAEWDERLKEAVQQAEKAGYERGHAEATVKLDAQVEQAKQFFQQGLDQLEQSWRLFLRESEPLLAALAFELAESLVLGPLPEPVLQRARNLLTDTIDQMAGETPIHVSLPPADFLFFQETGMVERLALSHGKLHWQSDTNLNPGEWIVQNADTVVRRLTGEMLSTLRESTGL